MKTCISLEEKIRNRTATIVVLGLGYIGFPTALMFANGGFKVIGRDINKKTLDEIVRGRAYSYEPGLADFAKSAENNLEIIDKMKEGDVYFLCIQTPLTEEKKADLTYLLNAARDVGKLLKRNNLVIVESTVPVGTTEKVREVLSEISGIPTKEILVAHCPERVIPTKLVNEITKNNRIIGGVDTESTKLAKMLYSTVIKGDVLETGSRVSELTKLAENIYRDVNIALANELSIICDKLGVNVFDVIRIANTHPRVNIHSPGSGVGGHCIPLDGYFLLSSLNDKNMCRLILAARKVNNFKSLYIVKQILKAAAGKEKRIGILGVTYKPDINDVRETPAKIIIEMLVKKGYNVLVYDPYTTETFGGKVSTLEEVMNSDVIAVLTPHKDFEKIKARLKDKNIINPFEAQF